MIHLRMRIRLVLLGPVLVQSNSHTVLGVDAVMARNSHGQPYLPYTNVRGKLRQALEEIASIAEFDEVRSLVPLMFGPRSGDSDFHQERGILNLTDFVCPEVRPCMEVRTRIQHDPDTGTARKRMLQVVDSPWDIDEEAVFEGHISCICSSRSQAEAITTRVIAGLKWIKQLGAERTVGFGRLERVEVCEVDLTNLTDVTNPSNSDKPHPLVREIVVREIPVSRPEPSMLDSQIGRFAIRLRPKSPFCIGGVRKGGNLFSSEEIIPGSVILGALATMWQSGSGLNPSDFQVRGGVGQWRGLGKYFDRITFSHAFPTNRGSSKRPTIMPLALVAAEPWSADIPTQLYDVSLCDCPTMVGVSVDSTDMRPPVFRADWKRHAIDPDTDLGKWPHVDRELRVRTAIDASSLRSADSQLFAYESIVPENLEWCSFLDLSEIPTLEDRNNALKDLIAMCSGGFGPFGKTKAWADIEFADASSVQAACISSLEPIDGDLWIVTLQTPALLCNSRALTDQTGEELAKAYREIWSELSKGTCELVRFFASQSLTAPRFARRLPTDSSGNYSPFVLTDSGSTFVLKATGDLERVKETLAKWLRYGLPVASRFLENYGDANEPDWQKCPYINRHGYGEIAVNLPWFYQSQSGYPIVLKGK